MSETTQKNDDIGTGRVSDAEMAPNVNGDGGKTSGEPTIEDIMKMTAEEVSNMTANENTDAASQSATNVTSSELTSANKDAGNETDKVEVKLETSIKEEDDEEAELGFEPDEPNEMLLPYVMANSLDGNISTDPKKTKPEKRKANETVTKPSIESAPKKSKVDALLDELKSEPKDEDLQTPTLDLGKGKRARIPNKRYSDIAVAKETPERKRVLKVSTENGLVDSGAVKEKIESETPSKSRTQSTDSFKIGRITIDASNSNLLYPFQFGWKREVVCRGISTGDKKTLCDIYYYSPQGKKLRSRREVSEHLTGELSVDDFTFRKESLGVNDPNKEIIREAKLKGGPTSLSNSPLTLGKMSPKVSKSTKSESPRASDSEADTPKPAKVQKTGFKVKVPKANSSKTKENKKGTSTPHTPSSKDKKSKENKESNDLSWTSPAKKSLKSSNNTEGTSTTTHKPCRPCSIRCEGVLGLIPTLQCRLCLCLYHYECVGLSSADVVQEYYICKNCQPEQDPNSSATSRHVSNENTSNNMQITVGGKEPETPKTSDATSTLTNVSSQSESKSILGSVTTWFPSSSTIQVGNNSSNINANKAAEPPPRPQTIEYIGNKKYLVVPKHNVLSVQPLEPQSDKTNHKTANQCDIKIESESPVKQHRRQTEAALTPSLHEERSGTSSAVADSPVSKPKSARLREAEEKRQATKAEPSKFMETYLQNLSFGYKTLLNVFQYLKVQDLLRAGCVCTMWRDVSRHPSLWSTVRMKNSQIHSFEGLANALQAHGTIHLDLRKMLLPASSGDEMWQSFTEAIKKVDSLRKIEMCRTSAAVVEDLAKNNPKLEVINAVTIKCENMSLEPFRQLTNLTDLRLKSTSGLTLTSDLSALKELNKLKLLSLTSIKDLSKLNIDVIGKLTNLEVLDLGECTDFPQSFGPEILGKLSKLEKLRLEKGQGDCYTFDILSAVKSLPKLYQLELVNFDIKVGFDNALGECFNLKKLLIIPTYISQSATTNHMVLGGVLKLQKTLSHFVWGVTLELLRVTELFVDQCEQPDKKDSKDKSVGNLDSIPVLKPVPLHGIPKSETPLNSETPQVEILPLPNLQKLLLQNLPSTRVKILKIPFHATWRQSITDSGN